MRGDDLLGCNALLHPALESFQKVMIGIDYRSVIGAITKCVWAVSTAAMPHARHHEEPVELLDFLPPVAVVPDRFHAGQLCPNASVVVDAVCRSNCRVRPPDVVDDLGAVFPKGSEVGISGIEYWPEVLIRERDIAREIERMEVPIRILKEKVREEAVSEELLRSLTPDLDLLNIQNGFT